MTKFFTLLGPFICLYGSAQTTNVTYTSSNAIFSNPDRGLYKFSSTSNGTYQGLDQATLNGYKSSGISLVYRAFKLDAFVSGPVSAGFLSGMQSDFDKIRNAGLKTVIRFTYSDDETVSHRDASKAQILAHIMQIKPLLQANVDIISVMQAGFVGCWGEWYYTSQAEFGGGGYNGTSLTTTNIANRKEVVDAILSALPASRMTQVRTPAIKTTLYSSTAISGSQAFDGSNTSRVGHHNDCFLASADDYGTYDNASVEYPYLAQDTKYVPMGGETCALNSPRSDCASAINEMVKFHWSFLNADYNTDVINGFSSGNCFTDIQNKLGYRFALTTATFPQAVALGTSLAVTIKLFNQGFASPYNKRSVYLVLKNLTTNQVYPILMNADPRLWIGTSELTVTENLTLPSGLTAGNYKLYLSLPDDSPSIASRPEYAIRFANASVWDATTGYNDLNYTLNVTGSGTLATSGNAKLNMAIYPVPTNDVLNIDMEGIADYKVSVYNSLGQNVGVKSTTENNKMKIDTQSLAAGLYFVEFVKGSFKDSRKIIVKH